MPIAFIDSTAVGADASEATTPAMDSSGANLLVVMFFTYAGFPATITDSKSNTWTYATPVTLGGAIEMSVAYCHSPTVGSGHTFTMNVATLDFSYLTAIGFSGAAAAAGYDTTVAGFSFGTNTQQPGSLTPVEDNEVLITFLYGTDTGASNLTINSGFTEVEDIAVSDNSNSQIGLAYKIQTTAGAENPTWTGTSWTAAASMYTHMTAFKAAAAAAGQIPCSNKMQQYLVR